MTPQTPLFWPTASPLIRDLDSTEGRIQPRHEKSGLKGAFNASGQPVDPSADVLQVSACGFPGALEGVAHLFFRTDVMALPTAPEDRLASAWICPELPDDALRIAASV